MVRFFFIQAIASLGCWTDIQTVHVRVSKPWAVAARQQFEASRKKHKTYAPKWTTGKHCLKQCFCSCKKQDWWSFSGILIYNTWLILIDVFLHPKKHQISISFRWSLGGLGSNQGASSWDGKKNQKLSSGQNSAEECHEMDAVATVTHQFQVFKNDLSPLRQFDLQTLSKKD